MNFSKINELKPYDLNCNIFDVYSYDGLSMQELLCQFFTKINECIKISNETIDLAEWLVNEGLKQEVALKLTTWLNDGTLENIINETLFENLNKKIDNVSSQLEYITTYDVFNEEDLLYAIKNKFNSVNFKNDVILSTQLTINNFHININLNGFTLKLSDDYHYDCIFEIGEGEYENMKLKHYKYIQNGIIDINDKNAYVLKSHYSWGLNCKCLLIKNTRKGFITYIDKEGQATKGAECSLQDVTIIASDNIGSYEIAFDWSIGDSMLKGLYSQYFSVGLRVNISGIRISDCHFWGLPYISGKINHIMRIGVWNNGYFNNYIGVIADTPERVNQELEASVLNGGIAFYDETSSNNRYINCDILEHASQSDNSIIGFYLANPNNLNDIYYGRSLYIINCYSRTPSKLKNGVHFTGKANNINIKNCDFGINQSNRIRGYDRITSNTTIYKRDSALINEGVYDFTLCKNPNEYQIINDDFGLTVLLRDSDGVGKWCRINEQCNNYYTPDQLQDYANQLKIRQEIEGQKNYMKQIFVVKYDNTKAFDTVGVYDICFWSIGLKAFVNLRTGMRETN